MFWQLEQSKATFLFHRWHGNLDLGAPEQGLQITSPCDSNASNILAVKFPQPRQPFHQDCYTRLGDVIVVYPQRESRKFNLQLDYRLLESSDTSILIELWISVQTYLLDSHPAVSVRCSFDLPNLSAYRDDSRGALIVHDKAYLDQLSASSKSVKDIALVTGPLAEGGMHAAWFNHPRDQSDSAWSIASEGTSFEAKLFGHFMEKGVIRRGRMRCLISKQPISPIELQAAYENFVSSPLPLTA
ncbi:MAG: hypothetical protein SGI77_02535 [Pirellulaceae bacterium]|nr:hypothetical protein [Pirellulaceae bacterium]